LHPKTSSQDQEKAIHSSDVVWHSQMYDQFKSDIQKDPNEKETTMNTELTPSIEKTFACETCSMRQKAEANPKTLLARLWRWHTGWCPGWKAYQTHLKSQESDPAST
jgi:hypothetical protein